MSTSTIPKSSGAWATGLVSRTWPIAEKTTSGRTNRFNPSISVVSPHSVTVPIS